MYTCIYIYMSRLYFTCIPACISLFPWYPAVSLYRSISSHFAADPRYPAVSHCIQLYPYISSCIQLCLLYPAVSHRISPSRKRDMEYTPGEG